jgi:hypothetical protein
VIRLWPSFLLCVMCAASNAYAVDGVVLIDQARALAGNVTPGDAPGFPVTISQRGSYKLGGNLTVPDGNSTAIEIRSSFVSIDLNGFSIIGPVDCSGGFPCTGAGTGVGITAGDPFAANPRITFNVTIRNGTIQGMGRNGIYLWGDALLVEFMTIRSNGDTGLILYRNILNASTDQGGVIVRHNHIHLNGGTGVAAETGLITDNTVSFNGTGISLVRGTVRQNVVMYNGGVGLALAAGVGYSDNTMSGNLVNVGLGINLGRNICGTVLCP